MGWDVEQIEAAAMIQQEANEYDDNEERKKIKEIIDKILDLKLTEEELNNLYNYALFLKTQRKPTNKKSSMIYKK